MAKVLLRLKKYKSTITLAKKNTIEPAVPGAMPSDYNSVMQKCMTGSELQ